MRGVGDGAAGRLHRRQQRDDAVGEGVRIAAAARVALEVVVLQEQEELAEQLVALAWYPSAEDEPSRDEPVEVRVRARVVWVAIVKDVADVEEALLDRQLRDEAGQEVVRLRHRVRLVAGHLGEDRPAGVQGLEELGQELGFHDEVDPV